jgi:hypothetical protein
MLVSLFLGPATVFDVLDCSSIEDLTAFNLRQEKQFPNNPGQGHLFVKLKGKALEKTVKPRAAI